MTSPFGCNDLRFIVDKLTTNFLELKEKGLSNKTSGGVGIIQMEEAMVPWEYGMEEMGH
jgi:hypothetical protein